MLRSTHLILFAGFDNYNEGGFGGGEFGGAYPMGGEAGGFEGAAEQKSEEKKYKEKNLVPVTIKQMLESENGSDDGALIDGKPAELVRVVAMVTSVEESATKIGYTLSDGTKGINGHIWRSEGDVPNPEVAEIKENMMVSAVGNMKTFNGAKSLFILAIRPITDYNEMTHHMLDAMMHHAIATKGPIPGSAAAEAIKNQKAAGQYNANFSSPSGGGGGPQIKAELGADGDDEIIRAAIATAGAGDEGANYSGVLAHLALLGKQSISKQQVEKYVAAGINDGTLYSTIDDDHFRLTSDM